MVSLSDDIKFFGKSVGTLSYFGKIFDYGSRFRFSPGECRKLGVRPLAPGKAELQRARGGRERRAQTPETQPWGADARRRGRSVFLHHLFASVNAEFLFYKEAILDSNQNRCRNQSLSLRDTAVPFHVGKSKFRDFQSSLWWLFVPKLLLVTLVCSIRHVHKEGPWFLKIKSARVLGDGGTLKVFQ